MVRRGVGLVFDVWVFVLLIGMLALASNIRTIEVRGESLVGTSSFVGGIITSNTTWTEANSPYIVTSSVLVSEGVNLTIEPGVVVKFESAKGLEVDGELIARGNETESIVFTSFKDDAYGGDSNGDGALTVPAAGDWAYIYLTDSCVDAELDVDGSYVGGTIMEYCVVEYAGSSGTDGAVQIDSSAPFLNCTTVCNSGSNGVYINEGTPIIVNSTISCNANRGINVIDNAGGAFLTISGNTITNNGAGIYASVSSGTAVISNNTISNNGQEGVSVTGSDFTISGNLIRFNLGGGIRVSYVSTLVITDNIIVGNSAGYYMGYGGGVYVYAGYANSQIIANNIIAYNTAFYGGALYYYTYSPSVASFSDNSIIGNTATASSIVYMDCSSDSVISFVHNLITQNRDSSTDSCSLRVNYFPTVNYNNFFGNFHKYEIYNANAAGSSHLDATNNYWGTSNETVIQTKIYDWFDDASKGFVDYAPFAASMWTDAPISPPTNVSIAVDAGNAALSWNRNSEADLAGYKIYYDSDAGYPFRYSVDVGNVTHYTLTGLPPNIKYFTVVAYDVESDGINDLFEGHESWYVDLAPPAIGIPSRTPAGDVVAWQNVKVSVNVTDDVSGIQNVTLYYTTNNGTTWQGPYLMSYNYSANSYEDTIYGQYGGTWVKFEIIAYDHLGYSTTLDGTHSYCTYYVIIPEYPQTAILPLLMAMTLLIIIIHTFHRRSMSRHPIR
jgi:parallel beta-helix repeat protein